MELWLGRNHEMTAMNNKHEIRCPGCSSKQVESRDLHPWERSDGSIEWFNLWQCGNCCLLFVETTDLKNTPTVQKAIAKSA